MSTTPGVLIAMSGGVDSSAAALLLQKQGYECAGATLSLCGNETDGAKRIADGLGMPFYIFDEHELFAREVMDHFVSEYRAGRTPNPCIDCNRSLSKGLVEFRRARRNKVSIRFVRRRVRRTKHTTCRKCGICAQFAHKLCAQRHAAFFKREPSEADRV